MGEVLEKFGQGSFRRIAALHERELVRVEIDDNCMTYLTPNTPLNPQALRELANAVDAAASQ